MMDPSPTHFLKKWEKMGKNEKERKKKAKQNKNARLHIQ